MPSSKPIEVHGTDMIPRRRALKLCKKFPRLLFSVEKANGYAFYSGIELEAALKRPKVKCVCLVMGQTRKIK